MLARVCRFESCSGHKGEHRESGVRLFCFAGILLTFVVKPKYHLLIAMDPKTPLSGDPSEALLGAFAAGKVRRVWVVLSIFLLLLLLLAWLIRYPDVLSVRVVLQAEGLVDRLDAALPGRIAFVPVREGQEVAPGDVLLIWEDGSASWQDVQQLGAMPMPLQQADVERIDALQLGSLAPVWAEVRSAWQSYQTARATLRAGQYDASTGRQLAHLEDMAASIKRQSATAADALALAEEIWQRSQRLADSNAISRLQAAQAEAGYLDARAAAEALEQEYHQILFQKEALNKELKDVRILDEKALRAAQTAWMASWDRLKALQPEWEARHILNATGSGRVRFRQPLQSGLWLEEGAPLLAIERPDTAEIWIARGRLPADGVGRVAVAAEADLRLDAFPFEEYGNVPGIVRYLSPLAENEAFLVEIEVSPPLITDTGKPLPAGPEMPATARIFTAKKRLLHRILEGFKRI